MSNIILFDNDTRDHLLPLTYTRPVCELRIGILTIREKWEKWLNAKASFITQDYLAQKYPIKIEEDNLIINGGVLPSLPLFTLVTQLGYNEALLNDGELIAARLNAAQFDRLMNDEELEELSGYELDDTPFMKISHPWEIFLRNGEAIQADFELLTQGRQSQVLSDTNQVLGAENIFLEEGAIVEFATLNAQKGPIYIGKNAEVMEGATVRGPMAMCESAKLKMGAKIYGPTTLGPHCKLGGEVNNSVLQGYSSKSHDGYMGNSVLGEWCNIGADANASNLKNNYGDIRQWSYVAERFVPTGQQFCGIVMGDHSKCGINTMFNTGTVVGVFANVFGSGFPRTFIPSFSWGGASGFSTYRTGRAFEVAEKVMSRRGVEFKDEDRAILQRIYDESAKYRKWDKPRT